MGMTPARLASVLRQIASRIDASENPSKSLVAADLKRLIAALMGRTKLLNEIDQVFGLTKNPKISIYDMKPIGNNKYEGKFSDMSGEEWTL